MAHLLGSPKTGPAASPSDPPEVAAAAAAASAGDGKPSKRAAKRAANAASAPAAAPAAATAAAGHQHSGGNHDHGHSHSHGHHGHSHSHGGGRGGSDPALSESASASSVAPYGFPLFKLPLFGGPLTSPALAALPASAELVLNISIAVGAAAASAGAASPNQPPLPPTFERELSQFHTRLTRNGQVLLHGDSGSAATAQLLAATYANAQRNNYSVSVWVTHAGSINAIWRQYAVLAQRIGLRSISLRPSVLVPNLLSWLYKFSPSTLVVLDRFQPETSIFVTPGSDEAAAAPTNADAPAATTSADGKKKKKVKHYSASRTSLPALTGSALDGGWLPKRGHSIVISAGAAQNGTSVTTKGVKSKLEVHPATFSRAQSVHFLLSTADSPLPLDSIVFTSTFPDGNAGRQAAASYAASNIPEATFSGWCADRLSCLQFVRALRATTKQPLAALVPSVQSAIAGVDSRQPAMPTSPTAPTARLAAVTTTALLSLILKHVTASGSANAWTLLKTLSVFDANDAIPRSYIDQLIKPSSASVLAELEGYGLVQYSTTDVFVTPTVQAAVRAQLSSQELVSCVVSNFVELNRTLRYSGSNEDTWLHTAALVPHILSLFSHVHPENVTLVASMKPIAAVVASAAAFVSDVHGETDLALALYQRAATFVHHIDEGVSDSHAIVLSGAGRMLSLTGDHARAIELISQARDICIEVFGKTSERVAREFINLSNAYKLKGGENMRAKEALEHALDIHRKLYGEWNEVADDWALMAQLSIARGDHNDALHLLTRAIEINTKVVPSSPEQELVIASRYAAISDVWLTLNRHIDAINFLTRSVEVYRSVYDSLHPALAAAQNRLGSLFQSVGRWQQARANFKKALDIVQQAAGDVHPEVLTLISNLGSVINSMGNSDVALSYYNHCWSICLSLYGESHPRTAEWKQKTMDLYAVVQKKQAEYDQRKKREADEKERQAEAAAQRKRKAAEL